MKKNEENGIDKKIQKEKESGLSDSRKITVKLFVH